jgi:predicted ATP-grasp superfamily ATP-dependent carboligase
MRVFIYEYTCGGGLAEPWREGGLRSEGWAMLVALLEDWARVPGVQTVTLLDERCPATPPGLPPRRIHPAHEATAVHDLARSADAALVIAPEFDDILSTRCRWIEEAGCRLLGPSHAAVALAGDKLALARHLHQAGLPTPACRLWTPGATAPGDVYPAVWKPRYGAGSQATFLVSCAEELAQCADQARSEGWEGEALVQPFVPGQPASVAFLTGPGQPVALPPTAQHLSADGRFHYLGGSLPLPADLAERAVRLGRRTVDVIPGLRGYVGVDLVLGDAADGGQDSVIEVNPRLTTSYVGLRALAQTNLAEALLRAATGQEVVQPAWRLGMVHFQADGRSVSFVD